MMEELRVRNRSHWEQLCQNHTGTELMDMGLTRGWVDSLSKRYDTKPYRRCCHGHLAPSSEFETIYSGTCNAHKHIKKIHLTDYEKEQLIIADAIERSKTPHWRYTDTSRHAYYAEVPEYA